jgi:hypothetical protein
VKEPSENDMEVELVEDEVDEDQEYQKQYSQAVKIINHNRLSKHASHHSSNY